jgi:hypothetical protein
MNTMQARTALSGLTLAGALLVGSIAEAAVTVRYYNRDSKSYEMPAKCSGSSYTVKFSGSTTASATIQGSSPCVVKAPGGEVTLKGGENIEIKDGKITIK